jgi:hypothetical protein
MTPRSPSTRKRSAFVDNVPKCRLWTLFANPLLSDLAFWKYNRQHWIRRFGVTARAVHKNESAGDGIVPGVERIRSVDERTPGPAGHGDQSVHAEVAVVHGAAAALFRRPGATIAAMTGNART